MNLRRVGSDDAEACVDILQDWIAATPWMPMIHSRASMLSFWRGRLLETQSVIAEREGVLGFAVRDGEHVTALYLAAHARRQGIGSALLAEVAGTRDTHLWTFQANHAARSFYAAQGFREVRRTDGDNEEKLPDVLLFRQGGAAAAVTQRRAGDPGADRGP
ncbi:MAG: GNAT family N-acetyltransferase [Pseudomonadota bacterium]